MQQRGQLPAPGQRSGHHVRDVETLYASAMVMYDRATESLWTHFDGRAVVGALTGQKLELIPSPLLGWSDFSELFPDGVVLDRNATGFTRPYDETFSLPWDRSTFALSPEIRVETIVNHGHHVRDGGPSNMGPTHMDAGWQGTL
ncbi:MAG: DUF3179 domain-containing (seleno)protein [Acidimicrobiia bacterium]